MAGRKHRPRGHIETRPNGTFRAIVYAGVDPLTGKERYLCKSAKHAQAEIELTKLQSQVDEQRHPPSAITIG
jgi:integrase